MTLPPYLSEREGALWLRVKAQPRASRDELAGPIGDELKVKLTAPPMDSAANGALVGFLAGTLGCSRRAVTLVRGQTSAHKLFRLDGVRAEEAVKVLAA